MIDRRTLLRALTGTAAAASVPGITYGQGSKFSLKLGLSLAQSHPSVVGMQAACADILNQSNGQLVITVFPNSQLGSDMDMISQVRSGAIEMASTSAGIFSTLVPAAALSGTPFAFADPQTAFRAMDEELGSHMRAGFSKANLVPIGKVWDHGFRHITTSVRPIVSVADLAGMKLRVPPTAVLQQTFRALRASPTTIGIGEVYTALQTRVVDGQENPLAILEAQRFYEVQKYCSLTGHSWDCLWLTANRAAWSVIPQNLQQIAVRSFDVHAVKTRSVLGELSASLQESLSKQGLSFNKVNVQPFRETLQSAGVYKEWKGKFGDDAWALLEKYSGKLA